MKTPRTNQELAALFLDKNINGDGFLITDARIFDEKLNLWNRLNGLSPVVEHKIKINYQSSSLTENFKINETSRSRRSETSGGLVFNPALLLVLDINGECLIVTIEGQNENQECNIIKFIEAVEELEKKAAK
jgi:hypothetical protein